MRDIEYLKSLYPLEIKRMLSYVSEACDRLDYKNSPMYDEYPDRMLIDRHPENPIRFYFTIQ